MRHILPILALTCAASLSFTACQNDMSEIGGALTKGEVTIVVDSIATNVHGESHWAQEFDSRTSTKLLGNLRVPEYGSLKCTFVSQLMSSTKMNIPDSIKEEDVDSMRFLLTVPRGSLTGDSLAPQQLKVYRLTKQLPSDIDSRFNPEGYYDPSDPYGVRSYTVSNIAERDTVFLKSTFVEIPVKFPKEFALEVFRKYRANDPIFQWPSELVKWLPGLFVEQNFGNGCVANISGMYGFLYWNYLKRKITNNTETNKMDTTYVTTRDSLCLFSSTPEVLSSNNINFTPSQTLLDMAAAGRTIVTSPGGYYATIKFPIRSLIDRFLQTSVELSIVSALSMSIPAKSVENEYGITVAPTLLLLPVEERESFFRENKIPDNITSFTAAYDSETHAYRFGGMRAYFLEQLKKYREKPQSAQDQEFCLVPVTVTTETVRQSYYSDPVTVVTRVSPYISRPSVTELETDKATVVFTFSSQEIK